MDDSIFDDLPEDSELAFVRLESFSRNKMEEGIDNASDRHVIAFHKGQYINEVIAAARALEIESISDWDAPTTNDDIFELYDKFYAEAQNIVIQIKISTSRRNRQFTVHLSGPEKQKIRHYIEQIKGLVEASDLPTEKKDSIYERLNGLTLEIDRDRTRFERVADGVRAVARLSGDFEREGLEPWWKWVKLIFGVIDEAKENERTTSLPAPSERKRIEGRRKKIPASNKPGDLDDEIPF